MPTEVTLHIYDVTGGEAVKTVNKAFRAVGTGAFHGAVEAYGQEWSFGACDEGSGVFNCPPKGCTAHAYRESVSMGQTPMSEKEVGALIDRLSRSWPGKDYDLLRRNCCTFSDEFCRELGVGPIPAWVTNLASAGASLHTAGTKVADTAQAAAIIALAKGQEVDAKYGISTKVEAGACAVAGTASALDQKYQVTQTVGSAMAGLAGAAQAALEGATKGDGKGQKSGGYQFGDVTRGLFSKMSTPPSSK